MTQLDKLLKPLMYAAGVAVAIMATIYMAKRMNREPMANSAVGAPNDHAPPAGGPQAAAGAKASPHGNGGDLKPSELLPAGGLGSAWSATNPIGLGDLKGQNFLSSNFFVGVNTIGQAKKNATHDLRVEPPNPKMQVSPWQNSTIEPDTMRRGLGDVGTVS